MLALTSSLLTVRSTDPVSSRVKEMIDRHYDMFEFPGDKEHFGALAVYVKKRIMTVFRDPK
jgi:hypothetical protein